MNGDAVAHELIAVAVARHDHTFNIVFFGDARKSAENIVGFKACGGKHMQPHQLRYLL